MAARETSDDVGFSLFVGLHHYLEKYRNLMAMVCIICYNFVGIIFVKLCCNSLDNFLNT